MAGHRRERGAERAIVARIARRRDTYDQALARARTPVEQVHAAAEYTRGVLTLLAGEPDAVTCADDVIRVLTGHCDDLVARALARRSVVHRITQAEEAAA